MSYASQDNAAVDPTFRMQVRQAVLIEATAVSVEAGGTTNHTLRSALASKVANQLGDDALTVYCRLVASDGVTLPGAADSTVLARVAALWNLMSGGL